MKKIIIIPLVLGGLFIILSAVVFAYCINNRQITTVPSVATSTTPINSSTDNPSTGTPASLIVATTTSTSTETSPELTAATSSTVTPAKANNSKKGGVMIPVTEPTLKTATSTKTSLANPASTNCTEKGGTLQIETRGDGGQYGLCYFEDNYACEEWALFRGTCPVGGQRTTGYDTIEQKYCAWLGGQTLVVKNAVCTFKDGSTCPDDALYNGTCSPKGGKIE